METPDRTHQLTVAMTRSVTYLALAMTRLIGAISACGCAFDTTPLHQQASGVAAPQAPAANPSASSDAQRGVADDPPPSVPPGNPQPQEPLPTDSAATDAAVVSDPPDVGVTGVPADVAPDAGAMPAADPEPSSSGLLDDLRSWIANSPRVAEAEALRRIMAAIGNQGGGPPDVKNAVGALGDVDCVRNARTCIAVCSWAVLNCAYCAGDATCVADLSQNCNRTCP